MSFAARATAAADRLVRHFGGGARATIRVRHRLMSALTGSIVQDLQLDGTHSQGAATLSLRAPSVQGILIKGVELEVVGDPTLYQVMQDVHAAGDALAAVPIDPVLQEEAVDEALVEVKSSFVDVSRPCAVTRFRDDQIDGSHVLAKDRLVVISLAEGDVDADVSGDVVINGQRHPIKESLPLQPGDTMATLRLHVGSAR